MMEAMVCEGGVGFVVGYVESIEEILVGRG